MRRFLSLKEWLPLCLMWVFASGIDRLWLWIDRRVPAWDDADYLLGTLNYWQAFQQPHWFSEDGWASLWRLSSKIPPLTYIAATPFFKLFGTSADTALLVNLVFSAILLGSVYGLGYTLFDRRVGLWAAFLCVLFPGLYHLRLEFLLDYPLTAMVTLCFFCWTQWRGTGFTPTSRRQQWLWAVFSGISLGLALMVKQTVVLFLFVPLLWVIGEVLWRRKWERLLQLLGGAWVSTWIWGGWYRANWLLILTAGKRATVDSAAAEGDPALNTIAAWTYYWQHLPQQISWSLLLIPLAGWVWWYIRSGFRNSTLVQHRAPYSPFPWLLGFCLGAYLLCSLNVNKDWRYTLPYLPVLAVILAWGLLRWAWRVRLLTVLAAIAFCFTSLFPIDLPLWQSLPPHRPYTGTPFPHARVIAAIAQTEPYLRSTLGVLPSTPAVNQHNFSLYGAFSQFHVYGRQVGVKASQINSDLRSLSWFLTKTGEQGGVPESQAQMVKAVEGSAEFELHQTWMLPDRSQLKLYHRRNPPVRVERLQEKPPGRTDRLKSPIQLDRVILPPRVPPGAPVPVTYRWQGEWDALRSGVILLTWQRQEPATEAGTQRWLNDRAIGAGNLLPPIGPPQSLQVTETAAMLPPPDTVPGTYRLQATYVHRQTGESYPLAVPDVALQIDRAASPVPAPELDLITQLRQLSLALPQGTSALDPVFAEIARINQYDPTQDYLEQAAIALEYRLQQEPQRRNWAYAVALARALQKRVDAAIAGFDRVVRLDSQNPYAYAYLAVVNLYDFRPDAAQTALDRASDLNPDLPELKVLRSVAALMQGNLKGAIEAIPPGNK